MLKQENQKLRKINKRENTKRIIMKKRSLLALAMVGALSVSMLAGCGSSSTKETQAPAGSEAATEAATEAAK